MATGNTIALTIQTIQARKKELIQYGAQKAVSTGCLGYPRMDFPGDPVVGSPLANVGDAGLIPWSRRTPHAVESLIPCATTTEPALESLCSTIREATAMRSPCIATREIPCSAKKIQHSQKTK